ncbi:MAG TPA: MFS transporter [Stellaceae bacterium]|nr:MFS transporter [Stellaceae bacterium]
MAQSHSYNVTAVINEARVSRYQWMVLGISLVTAMFDGYDTQGIAYVAPVMAKDLGIPPSELGPVFSAGLLGLTLGAIVFGMMADRIGRKQAIVWPVVIFAVFSILTPFGHSVRSIVVLRTLAGFGLGGTLPSVTAYVLEYSPQRMRALLVNSTGAFFAFGSITGGVLANVLIPTWGWQSTFYVGGVVPLLFLVVVVVWLPESVRFLLLSGRSMERVARIMQQMVPDRRFALTARFTLEQQLTGISVKHLFTAGRAFGTILIWIAMTMNLFVLVYLIFWFPTLLRQVGQPLEIAIRVTIFYSIGGIIGGLTIGWIADRIGSLYGVLATAYVGAGVFITIAAFSLHDTTILIPAMFMTGFSINGGQPSLNTISGIYYPTAIRATGIGWALGVGRIGAIVGPMVGGMLVGMHWAVSSVILVNIIPAAIAAVAILLLRQKRAAEIAASPAAVSL